MARTSSRTRSFKPIENSICSTMTGHWRRGSSGLHTIGASISCADARRAKRRRLHPPDGLHSTRGGARPRACTGISPCASGCAGATRAARRHRPGACHILRRRNAVDDPRSALAQGAGARRSPSRATNAAVSPGWRRAAAVGRSHTRDDPLTMTHHQSTVGTPASSDTNGNEPPGS
jgi:hypothetical protein